MRVNRSLFHCSLSCRASTLLDCINVDVLGRLLFHAIDKGDRKGTKILKVSENFSLQQFADDTDAIMSNDPNFLSHI